MQFEILAFLPSGWVTDAVSAFRILLGCFSLFSKSTCHLRHDFLVRSDLWGWMKSVIGMQPKSQIESTSLLYFWRSGASVKSVQLSCKRLRFTLMLEAKRVSRICWIFLSIKIGSLHYFQILSFWVCRDVGTLWAVMLFVQPAYLLSVYPSADCPPLFDKMICIANSFEPSDIPSLDSSEHSVRTGIVGVKTSSAFHSLIWVCEDEPSDFLQKLRFAFVLFWAISQGHLTIKIVYSSV